MDAFLPLLGGALAVGSAISGIAQAITGSIAAKNKRNAQIKALDNKRKQYYQYTLPIMQVQRLERLGALNSQVAASGQDVGSLGSNLIMANEDTRVSTEIAFNTKQEQIEYDANLNAIYNDYQINNSSAIFGGVNTILSGIGTGAQIGGSQVGSNNTKQTKNSKAYSAKPN